MTNTEPKGAFTQVPALDAGGAFAADLSVDKEGQWDPTRTSAEATSEPHIRITPGRESLEYWFFCGGGSDMRLP